MIKSSKNYNLLNILRKVEPLFLGLVIISATTLKSCSDTDTRVEQAISNSKNVPTKTKKLETIESAPEAEPISPLTIKRHPHLKHFEGQLLVSNGKSQMIISGIPPNSQQEWLDGILSVFRNVEGRWVNSNLFRQVQLKVSQGRDFYYPIGLTTDSSQEEATMKIILQSNRFRGRRTSIEFKSSRKSRDFSIKLLAPAKGHTPLKLRARLQKESTGSFFISHSNNRSFGITTYRNTDVFTILSSKRASSTFSEGYKEISLARISRITT